jgi:Listeria/Bacterioides repeat
MTHKLNRLTAMLLAVIMAFSVLLVPVSAAGFADVSSSAWYKSAVDYVSERGWMAGIGDDKFAPNMEVTRATFVTVLARYAGADVKNETTIFQDVPADKWYTGAVTWAAQNGIVEGIGDNCFAPGRSITRQDLCAILYRYMDQQGIELPADADVTCADRASVSGYALPAVDFFYASGLVSGFEDGSFRPKDTATRAQIASILMRFDKAVKANTAKPEQSFDSEAGEGMSVTVNAPVGALPEGTEMNVSRVTDEAALAAIQAKVSGNVLAAADISFNKNGEELEPETEVEVVINLEGIKDVQNPMIAHIKDDGTVEYVSAEMVSLNRGSSRALRFYARDFSVYVVTTDPSATYTVTVNFYVRKNSAQGASSNANDWELISKQVVRGNQIQDATETTTLIHDPGVPDLNEDQAFEGWTTNRGFTEETEGVTVQDINTMVRGLTGETELNYYSMVYDVVYVVYHDQAGAIIRTQYEHKDPDTGKATIIMDGYTPFKGEQNCIGWVLRDSVTSLGDHPTYVNNPSPLYPKNSPQEIEDVLEVYPYVQEGYWLSFNNNIAGNSTANGFQDDSHAEYISPVFYAKGVNTVAPSFPTNNPRPGYTFAGWYTDPAMRNAYSFGAPITADTTLYAKWTPGTASYEVVFWKQKSTDPVNAVDELPNPNPDSLKAKSYDYASYRVVTNVTTGSTATLTSADKAMGGTTSSTYGYYFTYNGNKSQDNLVVKGDGSTVLNVYYDRRVLTYNFYLQFESGYSSYNGSYYSSYYPHYGVNSNNNLIRIYTNASTYSDGDYNSPTWYTNAACTTRYSGTVYHVVKQTTYTTSNLPSTSGTNVMQFGSISGLYESSIDNYTWNFWDDIEGSDWPDSGSKMMWVSAKNARYQSRAYQFEPGEYNGTTEFNYFLGEYEYSTSTRPCTCLGMDENGEYTITLDNYALKSSETVYFNGTEYYGYKLKKYNKTSNNYNSATTFTSGQVSISYTDIGSSGHAYLWFERETYPLQFFNGTTSLSSSTVYYNKNLASYEPSEAMTPAAPEGYYFVGWYADPSLETPFDFTQSMPRGGVTVYAKFNPKWYRIVVDYKRGDDSMVVTVPGTTQKASFTAQYGTQVQTSALLSAKREGYILLGLYTDPECEHLFNENMQAPFGLVTPAQEVYPDSERTGVDDLTGATWSDVGYPDIRAKITLYAKWRKDPQGTTGLNLTYLGDNDPDTGYFNTAGRPHVWDDPELYVDMADAYAQPASVPETEGEQFLHWQILTPDLDENGNYQYNADGSVKMKPSGDIAYPGQTFQPELDDAVLVKTRLPDPNCAHTARTQHEATEPTCTTPGNNEYWQCNGCGKIFATENSTEEYADYEIPALGHLWGEATYSWDKSSEPYKCTATAYCERNNLHRLRETVTAELVEYDPAALNKPGKAHYVATFTNKPTFEDQTDTDVITTPALTGYVVTFSVPSGTMAPAQQVLEDGESADLSVTPTGTVDGWTFVGWVANPINDQTTTETTPLESYTPTGDKTLYALYTRNVAHGGTYTRVNSTQSNWAGNYVITYGNTSSLYALKGLTGTKSYEDFSYAGSIPYANTGMTRSSNGSTLTNVPERFVFTFEKDGSYYSIKNLETGSYLSRYASSSTALLRAYASYNATFGQWTPAYSSGHVTLTNNYSSSLYTGFTMLGFKTDGPYFWVNSSGQSDTENIYLWKETVAPGETTYYITNAAAISVYDVSFSVPEGVTAPATQTVSAGGSIVLPEAGNPDDTHRFLGWSPVTVSDDGTLPGTWYAAGALYTPSADVTLVALYMSYDEYFTLLTTKPSTMSGTYVISSGTTTDDYMMLSRDTGNYESASYKTLISDTAIAITTENGNKLMRNVPNTNRFTISDITSEGYTTYKAIRNNDGYYVNVNSSGYLAPIGTSLNTSTLWTITCTSGKFAFQSYNYSDYYMRYSGSYFLASTTTTPNLYLWKRSSDAHYATLSDGGSGGSTTTQYTVTYHTNGTTNTVSVASGRSITLPTPSGVGNASFVGWVTGPVNNEPTQPTLVSSPYTVTGNVDLYALYNNPVKTYELASSLTNGDKYILVDENSISGTSGYAIGNSVVTNNRYLTAVSVTVSNDAVTASDVASVLWQVGTSSTYYTFYNASAGKYIGWDSSYYVCPSSSAKNWKYTSEGYLDNEVDDQGYYYLSYDGTNGRYSTKKAGKVINFYKETTTNYYTTSVSTGTTAYEEPEAVHDEALSAEVVETKLTGALDIQALGLPETVFEQPAAETVGDGSPVPETKANVPQTAETETVETENVETVETATAATSAPQADLTRQGDIAQTASTVPTVPVTDGPTDPNGSSSVEYGEPVDAITDGETYFIGYHHRKDTDNDGVYDIDKVYLLMNHNPAANAYYTSASLSGYTCTKVCYAIPAILDENGKVIGVDTTNCAGATLDDVKWKFNLANTDSYGARYNIQSVYDDGMYLRIENDNTSTSTDLQLYPYTNPSTYYKNYWRWDSSTHYLSHYLSSGYLRKYISVLTSTSTGEVTCFEADSDSTYAKYINLYQYTEQATYTLTVRCKDADGNVLATKTFENVPAGAYTIDGAAIAVSGYQRTSPDSALSITMPASDYSVDIVFAPNVVSNERWEPTDTIVEGEDYLIAYVVNGTPYLLLNHSDVNNADYYTITSGSDTYNLGYLGQASTVTENGKTYVSGVSGPTTDLSNCHWRFVSVTGGYNIVVPETPTKGLYWGGSTSGIAGVVPNNSLDTWVWTATDNTNHYGTMKNSWTSAGGTSYTMYFYPRTSTGTASTTANPPYAGVSSSSFARIRLYHKAKELSTWNVSFVDQDGNALEGYPDQAVPNGQLLETPAAYQNEDYYFLGWFNEDGTPFDFNQPITADTIVVAHLQYAWEVKYTVYLQAVYGMVNKDGTTHIYWYTNDGTDRGVGVGAGYRQETLGLRINAATDIPTPTSYTYTDENGTTQTGLYRPGYTFLGWAREETVGAGNMGVDKTDLTADDLYIMWDSTRNAYKYNAGTAENPDWQQLTGGASSQGQVYADESRPYHDMYAVWAPAYYYVFHSSSGKLEQKNLEFTAATETQASMIKATDLTASVTPGYLYGGYYKTYGGVNMTAVNAKIKALEMGTTTWPDGVYNTGASESFVAYTGASAKNGTQKFWTRADAYQITGSMSSTQIADVKAETMRPVAGSVYYLKEVPDTYLANKFYYVYDNFNDLVDEEGNLIDEEGNLIPEGGNPVKTKLLQNLYFLSVIDDTNYTTIGYKVIDLVDEAEADDSMAETLFEGITKRTAIAKSVNFVQQNADVSDPENPTDLTTTVRPTDFTGIQGGYLEMLQLDNFISANNAFTVRPTWETLDGVQVSSKTGLGITIPSDCKYHETGEESFNDGGRGRVLYTANRLYIDMEHAKFKYTNNNGASFTDENWAYNRNDNKTVAYFFNDSGNTWVELQTSADYMKYVDVPDGYNKMILVMFGKDTTNYSFSNYWAKTADITLHSNKNCISSFYGYSSNSYVQKPTTDNFTVWANFAPDLDEEE